VVRDLWTAERLSQAHQKRHHACAPRLHVIHRCAWCACGVLWCAASWPREKGRYRVYDERTAAYLGEFADRRLAWAAADEHLVAEMLRQAEWVTGEYLVISVSGSHVIEVESQITHLGPPDDLTGCRRWLRSLPGRT